MRLHSGILAFGLSVFVVAHAAPAFADCADPRMCLCSANAPSSAGGLYRVRVEGDDVTTGAQLRVLETYQSSPLPDLDTISDNYLGEPIGTELLYRENRGGYLVIDGSRVRCPSGTYGDSLWVSLDNARLLSTVSDCPSELALVSIQGTFPDCDDSPSTVGCSTSRQRAPSALFGILLLGLVARRRRA